MTVTRWAGVLVTILLLAGAIFWMRPGSQENIIPAEFRGAWVEPDAVCQDVSAQLRVTGKTINYDNLSFIADAVASRPENSVSLAGTSFDNGPGERETLRLQIDEAGKRITLTSTKPRSLVFVRCVDAHEH